jgi:hypothetical protein
MSEFAPAVDQFLKAHLRGLAAVLRAEVGRAQADKAARILDEVVRNR